MKIYNKLQVLSTRSSLNNDSYLYEKTKKIKSNFFSDFSTICNPSIKKDFDYFRKEYFINPKSSIPENHINSITFIATKLLGFPSNNYKEKQKIPTSELDKFVDSLAIKMQESRKFDHLSVAQIHPNGNLPAILANISSTLRNNNTIIGEVSPVETLMERESVNWLISNIAQYDLSRASGAIVSGGTLANITGLTVARERLIQKGWDGESSVCILTTSMAHYSIKKAAFLLGPKNLIQVLEIPMQKNTFKMDTKILEQTISICKKNNQKIMAIVGVAGETETGLVDDLQCISEIADANKIYLHIDGAYGAPFILSKRSSLFLGLSKSDSLVIDGHKYLYTPYAAGSILFKRSEDHALIEISNHDGAEYMFKSGKDREYVHAMQSEKMLHLGKRRIEGSMGGQGAASIWAISKTLGTEGLKEILNHNIDVTEAVYNFLSSSKFFKCAHAPELNTLCFYPKNLQIGNGLTSEEQAQLIETASAILEKRTGAYLSSTTIEVPTGINNDRTKMKVFRFVATHPYTEKEDVFKIIENLHDIWDELMYTRSSSIVSKKTDSTYLSQFTSRDFQTEEIYNEQAKNNRNRINI